ncbi:MAG TPA: hypothetical protein VF092_01275 [Longimicrobium sp.]
MATDERIISDCSLANAARYLARLAANGAGYTLRGVSGWAHLRDVERGTRLHLDEKLPALRAMGLVDRVNVAPGGIGKPVWVYRITDAGARASAETWGDAYERVRAPGAAEKPAPVYLAPGPRNALTVLRLAYESGERKRFGEWGWHTGRELTLLVDGLNARGARHLARLDSTELTWLATVGLAEKRDVKLAWGRDRPVVYWRVSEAGRTVTLLSWRAPRSDDLANEFDEDE